MVRDGDKIIVYECKGRLLLTEKDIDKLVEHIIEFQKEYPGSQYYVVFRRPPTEETIKLLEKNRIRYIVIGVKKYGLIYAL